jgi:hypothetical protein
MLPKRYRVCLSANFEPWSVMQNRLILQSSFGTAIPFSGTANATIHKLPLLSFSQLLLIPGLFIIQILEMIHSIVNIPLHQLRMPPFLSRNFPAPHIVYGMVTCSRASMGTRLFKFASKLRSHSCHFSFLPAFPYQSLFPSPLENYRCSCSSPLLCRLITSSAPLNEVEQQFR